MNTCPTPAQLQRWLAGTLTDAESRLIETHVSTCPEVCQRLVASLSVLADEGKVPVRSQPNDDQQPSPPSAAAERAPRGGSEPPNAPVLPGYDILGQLGRGGMGVVYKARHRRMNRLVAIKVLPANLVSDAAAVARFEREVQAAARLHHANIVTAYDAAEANGIHFFVMEYIDGSDLSALVRRQGPLSVKQAVDCVLQAAHGLDYAHRHNVVHRDIKPSNLLYGKEGVVKVLDLGLARLESSLGGDVTELTGAGQIMGTIDYMAPEQAVDTHHADARADIYSLGMTLWYLLAGRPAYRNESTVARILAHRDQPIPGLCDACAAASSELECVFEKMVAKRPEDRYQSMAEVIAALQACDTDKSSADLPSTFVGSGSSSDQRRPTSGVGVAEPIAAEPVLASAVTLRSSELDTNLNAQRSLSLEIAAAPPAPQRGSHRLWIGAALVLFGVLVAAGAYTIRVQTGEGEVVVASEVDGISVDIVGTGESVQDWQIKAGPDNRRYVRTGTVQVKLPAKLEGELLIGQDSTRLVRDGKILVQITRRQKALVDGASSEKGEPARSNNRAVAEWVLNKGGWVAVISSPDTPAVTVRSIVELPEDVFEIYLLAFATEPASPVSEKELLDQLLRIDGNVRHLWLNYLPVTDSGLLEMTRIPALLKLDDFSSIGVATIGPAGTPALARMANLQSLNIAGTRLTTSSLKTLRNLPRLHRLDILARQIDDQGDGLRYLNMLRTLVVSEDPEEGLRRLTDLPHLRSLVLLNITAVDPTVLLEFERKNPLCRVVLGDTKVAGVDHQRRLAERLNKRGSQLQLEFLPKYSPGDSIDSNSGPVLVKSIALPRGCELSDEELQLFGCLTEIKRIDAPAVSDADRCAAALAEQRVVTYSLSMPDSHLTDIGLAQLADMPLLGLLDVRGTDVTSAGVEKFRVARPDCTVIWNEPAASTPDKASEAKQAQAGNRQVAEWVLKRGGKVAVISMPGTPAVVVDAIDDLPVRDFTFWSIILEGEAARRVSETEFLAQLRCVDGHIQNLWIADLPLSDDGLISLARIPVMASLYSLVISRADVGPDSSFALTRMVGLGELNIESTRITTSSLKRLPPLPRLHGLAISARQVDDSWDGILGFGTLRTLTLCEPTEEKVRQLGGVAQLRDVILWDTLEFNSEILAEIERKNPLCRVLLTPSKVARRDQQREVAEQLARRGARLNIWFVSAHANSENVRSHEGPVSVRRIHLPPGFSLDDEDLRLLSCLTEIKQLDAPGLREADRCAVGFSERRILTAELNLTDSGLTDAGLQRLAELPLLGILRINRTKVTAAAVEKFRSARPDCNVVWEAHPEGGGTRY